MKSLLLGTGAPRHPHGNLANRDYVGACCARRLVSREGLRLVWNPADAFGDWFGACACAFTCWCVVRSHTLWRWPCRSRCSCSSWPWPCRARNCRTRCSHARVTHALLACTRDAHAIPTFWQTWTTTIASKSGRSSRRTRRRARNPSFSGSTRLAQGPCAPSPLLRHSGWNQNAGLAFPAVGLTAVRLQDSCTAAPHFLREPFFGRSRSVPAAAAKPC